MNNNNLPPQNIEAEEIILGGLLFDEKAAFKVISDLPTEAFYVPAHRTIYDAIKAVYSEGTQVDLMTVMSWLNDNELLDQAGGNNKLAGLINQTVTASNIERYVPLIMEKYIRRQLIRASVDCNELGRDYSITVSEILSQAEEKIFEINQNHIGEKLQHINNSLSQTLNLIEDTGQGLITPRIKTGFYDLDDLTGGMALKDLVIVAGDTGMGKSSFAHSMILDLAERGIGTALFSMEMSADQINTKFLSMLSKIPYSTIESGNFTESEAETFATAFAKLSELPIYTNCKGTLTTSEIKSQIMQIQMKKESNLQIIFVDYIQLMGSETQFRVQELSKISRQLKQIADYTNTIIIGLCQLNREVAKLKNKRPNKSYIKDCGSMAQDASLIFLLYRDEYYNEDSDEENIAEVIVDKNRNGATGTIKLLFDGQLTLFKNMLTVRM